jgi:hypothetical protein
MYDIQEEKITGICFIMDNKLATKNGKYDRQKQIKYDTYNKSIS